MHDIINAVLRVEHLTLEGGRQDGCVLKYRPPPQTGGVPVEFLLKRRPSKKETPKGGDASDAKTAPWPGVHR